MGGFRERRSLICATTVCTVCEHAQPTSANIRWITRLIGIGGASRLPLPYGGSVDLDGLAAMHDALHHVLTTVAASGAHLHFGICQDCAYLGGKTCCSSTSSPLRPDERTVNWPTSNCIRCKTMDCVEVCPVDCFYEGENMLVIHPDECIDCGVCEPECPVDAIKADSDPGLEKWLSLNAEYARIWPNITVKKAPQPDSKEWEGVSGKEQHFSPNPGTGD